MGISLDNFTDTAGVTLLNHKGDKNAYWSDVPALSTTGALLISDANRLRYGTAGNVGRMLSAVPWTNEFDIILTCFMLTNLATWVVRFRWDTVTDSYYQIRFISGSSQIRLEKIVNGVLATVNNSAYTFSANTTLTVKVEVRNAAKKIFVNGVQANTTTNNEITAVGRIGLTYANGTVMSNTTGIHIDSLEVTSPHLFGRVVSLSVSKAALRLTHHLAGRFIGVSRTRATVRAARHLKGKSVGVSKERADARAARHLSGRAVGVSKERATARAARHLTGKAVGVGKERATARAARHLSGRARGVETSSADALHLVHHFAGKSFGVSKELATAHAKRLLIGSSVGLSESGATARTARHFAGRSVGSGVSYATAWAERHLSGRCLGENHSRGVARFSTHLVGRSVGTSVGVSTLLLDHHLSGSSFGYAHERAEIRIVIPRAAQVRIGNAGSVSLSVKDEKQNR